MGKRIFRQQADDDGKRTVGQQNTKNGPGQRKEQGLSEQLPDDAAAAGTNGGSHRQFMLTSGATGQKQDGHISAADGQKQRHRGEQQVQGATEITNKIVIEAHYVELEMMAGKVLRRFLGELLN